MAARARKLLMLITGLERGGAEVQVCALAGELSRRGWKVSVISMRKAGPLAARLRACGIAVADLGMSPGRPSLRGFLAYHRAVSRFGPELIHSHLVHANLLARAGRALGLRTPLINSAHGEPEAVRWFGWAYRYSDRWCDRFHAVSERALAAFRRDGWVSAEKLFSLPNGVVCDREPSPDVRARIRNALGLADRFTFLHAGRLDAEKDQQTLLRGFAAVRGDRPAQLLIAGDGPLRGQLEALCRELEPSNPVVFLGARDDVPDLLAAADAFVLSSVTEGLPVALLEAGAAGLPVVATEVGDVPRLLVPGCSAGLVPAGDPAALGRELEGLLALAPAERERLGQALRARVHEHFSLGRIVDRWEDVYCDLIEAGG
ncbi:MAG: glycosyltransferase [Myxococcota bacterium]|nr:glycosyltransferase [Myxococcota bacterium]